MIVEDKLWHFLIQLTEKKASIRIPFLLAKNISTLVI